MSEEHDSGRVGFAALIGRPNVGKSTLLNLVLGEKIAIVSERPQTTRNRIMGARTWGKDQLILLDTPGIHRSRANLNQFMIQEALQSIEAVDCVVLVTEVDPRGPASQPPDLHPDDAYVLEQIEIQGNKAPLVVAINKIDKVRDRRLILPMMEAWRDRGFETLVPISALHNEGFDALLDEVKERLPRGPLLYPEDMLTDRAERFLAAELIREQIFARCRQEIPYSTAVEVEQFTERPSDGDVKIEAVIHVERESQKAIVIGRHGAMIKEIGTAARHAIAKLVNCPVHLKLIVHVEPQWTRSPAARRKLGYE
jgi:GTP-binding protein Era